MTNTEYEMQNASGTNTKIRISLIIVDLHLWAGSS